MIPMAASFTMIRWIIRRIAIRFMKASVFYQTLMTVIKAIKFALQLLEF